MKKFKISSSILNSKKNGKICKAMRPCEKIIFMINYISENTFLLNNIVFCQISETLFQNFS